MRHEIIVECVHFVEVESLRYSLIIKSKIREPRFVISGNAANSVEVHFSCSLCLKLFSIRISLQIIEDPVNSNLHHANGFSFYDLSFLML